MGHPKCGLLACVLTGVLGVACGPGARPSPAGQVESSSPRLVVASPNLIANPSVETPDPTRPTWPLNWRTGGWGTNSASFTYDVGSGNSGNASVRIDIASYTSGDAKWIFDAVAIEAGTTYIYSDYYKASTATKIVASYTLSNGTIANQTLANAVPASAQWTKAAYSLVPPAGSVRVTVYHLIAGVGTLQLDDASLALPQPPDVSSGVPNGSFEQTQDTNPNLPLSWQPSSWGTNQPTFTYELTGRSGDRSVSIVMDSYSSGDAKWVFAAVPIFPGTTYVYSDYYRATVATKVVAAYSQSDGTTIYQTLVNVVPASPEWNRVACVLTPPAGASRVTVYHLLAAVGTLVIDDVGLRLPQTPDLSSGVPNGNLEQASDTDFHSPLAWQASSWGTNQPTFTYESTGHSGTHSVSVAITDYTNGDAKWFFDSQPVAAGTRYLYSDFYLANVPSFITVAVTLADGSIKYLRMGTVPPSPTFTPARVAFLAPQNAVSATVYHGLSQVGYLQIDDAALAPLPAVQMVNGVPNGDFEQEAFPGATVPAAWYPNVWGTNSVAFSYPSDPASSNHSARIDMSAYTNGAASWYFDEQPVQPGGAYRITETYRADVDTNPIAVVTLSSGAAINVQLPVAFASPTWANYSAKIYLPNDAATITLYHKLAAVGYLEIDNVACLPTSTAPFARGLVTVTFDDAWLTDATNALPVLAAHHVAATHYVITSAIGDPDRLTMETLSSLAGSGEEIGSHTVNHLDLTTLSQPDLANELVLSKQFLEGNGFGPTVDFASPGGAYNASAIAAIKAVYQSHRTVDEGYNAKDDWDVYRLKVQNMRSTTTVAEVDGWAARAAADRSWLIIVYHDVVLDAASGSIYSTTRANLDAQLTAIESHNLPIVTLRSAISEIDPQLVCDDGNICTTDTLVGGYCQFANNTLPCDDLNACTVGDTCDGGSCRPGATILECGLYACDSTLGCRTACTTGAQCLQSAVCNARACADSCDDGNPCTTDAPDADRLCGSTVKADGAECGVQSVCRSGHCRKTCATLADCDSGFACEGGLCTIACNDNNPCTAEAPDDSGTQCMVTRLGDGTDCSGSDRCHPGVCAGGVCTGGAAVVCDRLDQCHLAGTCDPATGTCSNPAAPDGASCSDGNACTSGDTCRAGGCVGGAALSCDDGNACTTDSCNSATGCAHTAVANGTGCDDGNACTVGDSCQAGACRGGAAATCNDGNSCTADLCDPGLGCFFVPVANGTGCDDGNLCTTDDSCQAGVCRGGPAAKCDDGNVCTVDSCDPNTGCVHTAGNAGTVCRTAADACDIAEQCTGTSTVCPADQFQPRTFTCRSAANACDSAEQCTGTSAACPGPSDHLAPTLSAGTDQTVLGSCSTTPVTFVMPTVTYSGPGQCDASARVSCTSIAGNKFGANKVTCTATDTSGNVSSPATFTVTVLQPLAARLQAPLAPPSTNNVARVGWTVPHVVKLFNCANQDVTATAPVSLKVATSLQIGSPTAVRSLTPSLAPPDSGGIMTLFGSGSSATYRYNLGTKGFTSSGQGNLRDTKYYLSTMTASYKTAPTINAGWATARLALTP